ncbi:MAG: dTDP-6-deoxy-3,4-keto-hexulose isomerase [Niastella sp. SCN 39-18]|nr:FdtA/QdtA family cupin domain-containing protein [Sphingobacteriales bacterium]ODT55013.1 MAG: dTDP-6-deoxy-3,4-keto-hexulose isomerase [Niastella sp. SCN 39-18]OJW08458.1 MAG: dTDP-6-deoxy-3,4-keto-hexulose isomerase [Sphingobacteriales bacterium 39-19]
MVYKNPQIIQFPRIGNIMQGYISVAENNTLPFEVKRVYWTYHTPGTIHRGGHAHHELVQILVAVAGTILVETEIPGGIKEKFTLDTPEQGLLMPVYCWHTMQYSHNAVQMCIANMPYKESDYIRDYEVFKQLQ